MSVYANVWLDSEGEDVSECYYLNFIFSHFFYSRVHILSLLSVFLESRIGICLSLFLFC